MRFLVSLAVAVVLLALLLAWGGVAPAEVVGAVGGLGPSTYAAALAVHAGIYLLRALRFRLLVPPSARPALGRVIAASAAHNLAADVLPAKTGEAALVLYLRGAAAVALFVPLAGFFVLPAVDAVKSPRPLAELLRAQAPPGTRFVPFLDVRTEEYRFYSGLDCREVDGRSDFLESLREPAVRLGVLDGKKYEKLRSRLPAGTKVLANRVVGGEDRVVVIALPGPNDAAGADDGG